MNCQAFRKAWPDDTDSDIFSHIESCEDCIAWIETHMTTEEEVQFLKEVPLPQANLEERIMQAIYQNAGQGVPPHAATEAVHSQQAAAPVPSKRRTKGFPSFAWVSAAAVLLAVGFISYQQLQGDSFQTASQQPEAAQAGAGNQIAMYGNESSQMQDASPASAPASARSAANATVGNEQPLAKQNETAAQASQPAASVAQSTAPAPANREIALNTPQAKAAVPKAQTPQAEEQASVASATVPAEAAEQGANVTTALGKDEPGQKHNLIAGKTAGSPAEDQQAMGITAMSVPEANQAENSESEIVGPTLAKQPITLSTFTDTDTAVQASDMPVPVLAQNANSFSLSTISVQYESETSQKVTRLSADYKHNDSWIRIEVVRNAKGKRSLSIPGTFSATQLFAVNGEQAIAVSFDNPDKNSSAAEHAVHFNAQSNNQSLYVVVTAHGISLDELIETSKQLTWKP